MKITQVRLGRITIEQVPAKYREAVRVELGGGGNG